MDEYVYTIHLRVDVTGPEDDWDDVAERLRRRVDSLALPGTSLRVSAVEVDEAGDAGKENEVS